MSEFNCVWKDIEGYKFRYRISDEGVVQKQLDDGSWYTLTVFMTGRKRPTVKLRGVDGSYLYVPIVWLMADAFMGGRTPGTAIIHRNGMKWDCSETNLLKVPHGATGKMSQPTHRKPVVKIDYKGRVVDVYSSGAEAARRNKISRSSVFARCKGQVKDPFALDGYDYRYEEGTRRGRPKKVQIS